jgi:hypothetical protein
VQNYVNYFTEIEEHFQRRRGSLLLLSTLDWALIETWRESGVPLTAALRGIDAAFDKFEARTTRARLRRINGLAWCAQAVMEAVEAMQEAAVGGAPVQAGEAAGLERERIAKHLQVAAEHFRQAAAAVPGCAEIAARLLELAAATPANEEMEQQLTTLEERLFAMLTTHTPEAELQQMRAHAAQELAPYRSRMQALQIRQIEQQFLRRRLLERYELPRISLFYMQQEG